MHFSLERRALNILAVTVLAVTVLAAGCGSAKSGSRAKPEITDVSVDLVAAEGAAGMYVAQDKGYFRQLSLNVKMTTVTSAAAALPGLLHGSVDIYEGQYTTFIQAEAAGVGKFRVLAPGWSLGPRVEEIVIPAGSPLTSVGQLKGQTIAVNQIGGVDQLLAESILRAYNISPGQVHWVAIPFAAVGAALAAHRFGAAYLTEPYLTEVEQQQGAQVLADVNTGATQSLPIAGFTAMKAWAQKYPRTAAAFAKAVEEGNNEINVNQGVFQQAMRTQLHLPPQVADVMAMGVFPDTITPAELQDVANFLVEFQALKQSFNTSGILG